MAKTRTPTLYILDPIDGDPRAHDLRPRLVTAWREDSALAYATLYRARRATPTEAATLASKGVTIEDATADDTDSAGA